MGRTTGPDEAPSRPNRGPRSTQSRSTLISKALSRLLRHQAVNERIPITSDGWVKISDVLKWKGLSSRNGVDPTPTLDEIFTIVQDNEKKRFAVKLVNSPFTAQSSTAESKEDTFKAPSTSIDGLKDEATPSALIEVDNADNETDTTIAEHQKNPLPAEAYMIRANQGHSIAVDNTIMTPITTDSAPSTCVHGTFYGAWPAILASGGLKRMARNHVHFASGPTLDEVSGGASGDKVISGMRRDAQILIYVDIKKALEDGMKWFKSENGVILTEGVEEVKEDEEQMENEQAKKLRQQQKKKGQAKDLKMVEMKYWDVVVDIKGGRGVIWKQGEGVVKELPGELIAGGNPKDRGRGGGRGDRGGGRGRARE